MVIIVRWEVVLRCMKSKGRNMFKLKLVMQIKKYYNKAQERGETHEIKI